MGAGHRLTISALGPDPRAAAIEQAAADLGLELPGGVEVADIVFVDGDLDDQHRAALERLLVEPLLQTATWSVTSPDHAVEFSFLPGVTDTAAATVLAAAHRLDLPLTGAATGRRITVGPGRSAVEMNSREPNAREPNAGEPEIDRLVRRVIANPVIERWGPAPIDPPVLPDTDRRVDAEAVIVRGLVDDELTALGLERSLALDLDELRAVRDHFTGEGRDPTDVELETLAQTWSEHCSHKTFRADLTTDDGRRRPPLLDALRRCTDDIDAPFVRSAFVGNAGIISFVPGTTIALKAETHNHPSAVEPFGGANTGVGGVIRDVLGAAHRPIAITDVLCFGPPDTPADQVPDGALHPRRIRAGVVDGVADYGNKIGLPTVAGAVLYDPAYTTNPLVFAGCIGAAPTREPHTGPHPDDRVVVLGGRTGRDGIRGATFSSLTMDATTGEVAGASVQIGDPVTEKLLIDVLVGAEDIYSAITDCGAGGLSSAVGEMAEGVGADVELDRVPLKYTGLAPWEIWLSEAQERMVVAVPPDQVPELRERCDAAGVELADLGAFTGDGRLRVRNGGTVVLDLDTAFLHDGRPTRRMTATMPRPVRTTSPRTVGAPADVLLALLAHRNIASKAATIHRYDHEIRGATLVRPLVGTVGDGPADGIVLAEPHDHHGLAIGIGVNPWYGLHDPEAMAAAAVDEAIRNVVAVGADPDRVALLDNFSWGDPRRPSTLGELVAAVDGCVAAARAHAAPFVSGKDSLNNEYSGSDGERHAVPPTLVITAVAHVPHVDRVVTPDLVAAGDVLVLIGSTRPELAGSHLDLVLGEPADPGTVPQPDPRAPVRYRRLHRAITAGLVRSCHDPSEGGLAVALAEMCIAGRLGAHVDPGPIVPGPLDPGPLDPGPLDPGPLDPAWALFAESTGRFVVAVRPGDLDAFRDALDEPVIVLGQVTDEPTLRIGDVVDLDLGSLVAAFHRTSPEAHA